MVAADDSFVGVDEIMTALAQGAAQADMAARAQAGVIYREAARAWGPELASAYVRDWRLSERTVVMRMQVEIARTQVQGLLRLVVKERGSQVDSRSLEVTDRYVAATGPPLASGEVSAEPSDAGEEG